MKDTTIQQEKDGKFGIIALVLSVLLVAFYFFMSQNDEKSSVVLNESRTNSTIETDSLKRLETYGSSGVNWGMSPFGSGKPLTEEEKPVFKKPNLEWKTRTINGITYVFGEGNPKEVALTKTGIEEMNKSCADIPKENLEKFCGQSYGNFRYVSKEVENHIMLALSDPNWVKIQTECRASFYPENLATTSQDSFSYDEMFSKENMLDINNYISIDPQTGLKIFTGGGYSKFLMEATLNGGGRGELKFNKNGDCVDKYASGIIKNLDIASAYFNDPLNYSEDQLPVTDSN